MQIRNGMPKGAGDLFVSMQKDKQVVGGGSTSALFLFASSLSKTVQLGKKAHKMWAARLKQKIN